MHKSLYTSCIRVNLVKRNSHQIMSKSHHTQNIRKNSVHKLFTGHAQILKTEDSCIVIKIYESTVSIIQLQSCKIEKIQEQVYNSVF